MSENRTGETETSRIVPEIDKDVECESVGVISEENMSERDLGNRELYGRSLGGTVSR